MSRSLARLTGIEFLFERQQVFGVRLVHRQSGDEALGIEHAAQAAARVVQEELVAVEVVDRVQPLLHGILPPQGLEQPLPQEQQEVLILRLEQELSLEEIGQITGVGRETVKSRLRYAMDKLRARLSE